MEVSVENCARCGNNHDNLLFTEFTYPVELADGSSFTHFCLCPNNGEPILLETLEE